MKSSTIITSNRSIKEWVNIFAHDEMAATAILDRLFHKATIFNIDGNSYLLRKFNQMIKESERNGH
jgi:DNA replication protein DnaC